MKKKVIALAIAAAVASPLAMAETTLYGTFDLSYDFDKAPLSPTKLGNGTPANGNTAGNPAQNVNGIGVGYVHGQRHTWQAVSSNGSFFGIKGSHPIGGGTNILWQVSRS